MPFPLHVVFFVFAFVLFVLAAIVEFPRNPAAPNQFWRFLMATGSVFLTLAIAAGNS